MEGWNDLPLDKPLYANVDPTATVAFQTASENAFLNDIGGTSRFPGYELFAKLPSRGKVFLNDYNGDLVASTSKGQTYRIDRRGRVQDMSQVPVSGGRRTIFAKTDKDLLMAAGGPIVRMRGEKTELLSPDAPEATHVGWIDGYTLAAEVNSGRFYHSAAGQPDVWNPLDTFVADGSPDNINGLIVTPFREILIAGPASIEQFDRAGSGNVPFFRRYSIGDGVSSPYAMVFADNAVWTLSSLLEVVRFQGQTSIAESSAIGRLLEGVDDWSDAWFGGYPDKPFHVLGQKFIIFQIPNATNSYGTKGITLVVDYAAKRWFEIYGWDEENAIPKRWPGWSHWTLWNEVFIGGEGAIYRVTTDRYTHSGERQRLLVRTAVMQLGNRMHMKGLRLVMKRGTGTPAEAQTITVACSRDGKPFGTPIRRSLGKAGQNRMTIEFGQFGIGSTFQFEFVVSSDTPVEIVKAQYKADGIGQ